MSTCVDSYLVRESSISLEAPFHSMDSDVVTKSIITSLRSMIPSELLSTCRDTYYK